MRNITVEELTLSFTEWMFWITSVLVSFGMFANYLVYKHMMVAKRAEFKLVSRTLFHLCVPPLLFLGAPVFIAYKHLIHFILKIKHGSKYGGIIDGQDSFFNLEKQDLVPFIIIIRYKPKNGKSFYDHVRDTVYQELVVKGKHHPKVFGAVRMFMGYSYLLKNELIFNDCFKKLKTVNTPGSDLTKNDLLKLTEEYLEIPLPKHRDAFWDVFIGTQPVQWTSNIKDNSFKTYPILFRMNHTLADGKHIIPSILRLIGDSDEIRMENQTLTPASLYDRISSKNCSSNSVGKLVVQIILYLRFCYAMCLAPAVSFVNSLIMATDDNILHGPRITHKKHLLWNANNNRSINYLTIAKHIKKKIPNCTVTDVFLTAIAATFKEYFQKSSTSVPNYIVTEIPLPAPFSLADLRPPEGRVHCRNRLSYYVRKLPINVDFGNTNTPLISLLRLITKEGVYVKNSIEREANYVNIKAVCHFLPAPLLKPLMEMFQDCTVLISNLPGPSSFSIMDGCIVEDLYAWAATRGRTGVSYVLFSYDERLLLSVSVDKSLVNDKGNIQCLSDGFYKYLDMLNAEVNEYL